MEELTEACQQNSLCSTRSIPLPFDRLACIRKCVSPNCYASVYLDQPLEPGEIDVKYSKYKACFHRHWRSRYANTYSHLNELQAIETFLVNEHFSTFQIRRIFPCPDRDLLDIDNVKIVIHSFLMYRKIMKFSHHYSVCIRIIVQDIYVIRYHAFIIHNVL